ncbi:MAG: ABC transporter permease [Clostridia bacterium]|nr:ABC transporter permease [Clostridia bacterium]
MKASEELTIYRRDYLKRLKRRERFVQGMRFMLLVALLFFWELAARLGWIDPFITSSPGRVLATLGRLLESGELFTHIGVTLFETVAGFLIGTLLGTLVAALLWWSPVLCRILDPYLVVLNALPKIALGPILIVWIGAGMGSIIVMAVLVSLVVTICTVLTGFLETSGEKQLLMRTLGASKPQIFRYVVLPASVPTIVAALKMSVSMSWVGVIVGEYLVSRAGLGFLIVYGGQVFQLDLVMASIVVLCALAALMYVGVAAVEKRIAR